jgi:hypothetical protein
VNGFARAHFHTSSGTSAGFLMFQGYGNRTSSAGTPAPCSDVGDSTGPGGDAGAVATKETQARLAAAFAIPPARDPCALGLEPDDVVGRRRSNLAASVPPFTNLTLLPEQSPVY